MTEKNQAQSTIAYYNDNVEQFFSSTVGVDMSPIYERFLVGLTKGARILDAGCGSGRDAKTFSDLGYAVSAFDASAELAKRATEHCGFAVDVRRFEDITEVAAYDAIWCCASLLHVPERDMSGVLQKLWAALKPGGRFYVSYKLGRGERSHNGRFFTDANEETVRAWLADMPELEKVDTWQTTDQRPLKSECWINALAFRSSNQCKRLVTGGDDHFLQHLSSALAQSNHADIAVSFVKATGLRLFLADFYAMLESKHYKSLRVLTSDYLGITDPQALRLLMSLKDLGAQVRVYCTQAQESFHMKAYMFGQYEDNRLIAGSAFVGSSNLSRQALQDGLEWNYRVVYPQDAGYLEMRRKFESLFISPRTVELTDDWIDAYEQRRVPPTMAVAPGSDEQLVAPEPNDAQRPALLALAQTREAGYRRGLVVLATGLGKTWLAAFDAVQMGAQRILFVAHREEILNQAATTFNRILPDKRIGFLNGQRQDARDADVHVLFASVQTLGKTQQLARFAPEHFDYIVVDEFHHAAAPTYRRLLWHFSPRFMLGLTATPDRTDQSDILSLCDDNLVYSFNLFDGINDGLLAPFHYYGIHDESVDYKEIPWRNGRFDPETLSNKLATQARSEHALKHWREKAQQRTLAFCVSTRHADNMAENFNRAGVSAAAVYSGSALGRAEALEQLQDGRLQVLFSVDLFNEGVDLPSIDTILMLRPTESKVLFLQQLGRGLRRHQDKEHLVVLDFIGNHQAFLSRPQALFAVGGSFKALAQFGRTVQVGDLELPSGCYVNYDLSIIDFLKSLDSSGPQKDYEALRATLGRRPTLSEFYRSSSGVSDMRRQAGSWFGLVSSMGDLSKQAADVASRYEDLLRELETTQMTKSFKAITLEAWLELDGLSKPVTLEALAERSRAVLDRRPALLSDLDPDMLEISPSDEKWLRYWRKNPVNALVGGNRSSGSEAFFSDDQGNFMLKQVVSPEDAPVLGDMLQELVDYRLATYEGRGQNKKSTTTVQPSIRDLNSE